MIERLASQSRSFIYNQLFIKIFPRYVNKIATEASCYNLFFHGKVSLNYFVNIRLDEFSLQKRSINFDWL